MPSRKKIYDQKFKPDKERAIIGSVRVTERARHWVNSTDFRDCKKENLVTFDLLAQTYPDLSRVADKYIKHYKGDTLAQIAFDLPKEDALDLSENEQITLALFMLLKAAKQGSNEAVNEMGASLLYCYGGIKQDLYEAGKVFSQAAKKGDVLSMHALALMYLAGMVKIDNPERAASSLLWRCAWKGSQECIKGYWLLFTSSAFRKKSE